MSLQRAEETQCALDSLMPYVLCPMSGEGRDARRDEDHQRSLQMRMPGSKPPKKDVKAPLRDLMKQMKLTMVRTF
eukprot:COSAG02_NODE_3373_length_6852_cov_3.840071_2_plen_75_part_00